MASPEVIVRTYLAALKDPDALRDDEAISEAESSLAEETDPIQRLKLQQRLNDLRTPSLSLVEDEFIVHAKAWAEDAGLSAEAFQAEGVPSATLRRAGFTTGRRGRGGSRRGSTSRKSTGSRNRVTTEEVIEQMPAGAFTLKSLRELTGASPAVVRKAVDAELESGAVVEGGADPDHSGPGRAPMLYRKS